MDNKGIYALQKCSSMSRRSLPKMQMEVKMYHELDYFREEEKPESFAIFDAYAEFWLRCWRRYLYGFFPSTDSMSRIQDGSTLADTCGLVNWLMFILSKRSGLGGISRSIATSACLLLVCRGWAAVASSLAPCVEEPSACVKVCNIPGPLFESGLLAARALFGA